MRTLLSLIVLFGMTVSAQAYSTYASKDNTCNQLQETLDIEGIIGIQYQFLFGGHGYHVSSRNYCGQCYSAVPANVKSKTGWCTVGYKCREKIDSSKTSGMSKSKKKRFKRKCEKVWRKNPGTHQQF